MSTEQNKDIVKIESIFLQKVGNQIAITNKLLNDNFDYLKWWSGLDKIWRDIFETLIGIAFSLTSMESMFSETTLSEQKEKLANAKKEFDENDITTKIVAIKYLLKVNKMTVGRKYSFELTNLSPLLPFKNLEQIQFINAELKDIQSLKLLNNLKQIIFVSCKVNLDEINNFQKEFTDCKIIFTDKHDSDLIYPFNE